MPENDESKGTGILSFLVLMLLTLLIILIFFGKGFDVWKLGSGSQICRKSVEMHSAAHIKGIDVSEDIKCPPTYEKIDDADDKVIKQKIADLAAECFWKFGANELELFGGSVLTENRFCALCSHIQFKGSAKSSDVKGFRLYLTKEYVPQKYLIGTRFAGSTVTYADYIIGRPTDPKEIDAIAKDSLVNELDTDKDYGVMFVYVKDSYVQKVWSSMLGGGTAMGATLLGGLLLIPDVTITKFMALALISSGAGAGGAALGEAAGSDKPADWQSAVLIIPYDETSLKKLDCNQLPVKQGNK